MGFIYLLLAQIGIYTAVVFSLQRLEFLSNELAQDAVIRNIEIIGEASNSIQRVAPDFAAAHDGTPWLVMYTMRNRFSHGYDKVDLQIIWNTVQQDFPRLYRHVEELAAKGFR